MGVDPGRAGSLVGQRLGKYDVLALLAIGGTAEIYLARIVGEAGFEKYVVIKCLLDHLADDADFVRMFLDEARIGAQLDHSNIVQTLELGQYDNRYFMAMEYLAGMSLAQLARKTHEREPSGVIPVELVIGLAAQAASGLHYAHERTASDGSALNVVHRDVSPQNLVITFEGVLKIVDFGIAKAEQRQTHTRTGTIKGKFAYMSPEQCMAEPIDRRTDVFALGTVVHELLTARRLFKRSNTYETYQAIVKGNVPPPSRYNDQVDEALDEVLLKALAYHKEDRYDTAEELGEAMLGWLHSRGKSVSASDVSRYVERVCAEEIDDHADHMRELIEGRQITGTDHLRWDTEADVSESLSLQAQPIESGLLSATDFDDDDGDFGGDTQIELDPSERLQAIDSGEFKVPSPEPTNASSQAKGKQAAASSQSSDNRNTVLQKRAGTAGPSTGPTAIGGPSGVVKDGSSVAPSSRASAATVLHDQASEQPQAIDPLAATDDLAKHVGDLFAQTPPPGRGSIDANTNSISVYDTPPPMRAPWQHEQEQRNMLESMPRAQALPPPAPMEQGRSGPGTATLIIAFLLAMGVGIGVTVLFGSLV